MPSRAENNANETGTPFHVGLTPALVVGAATELTQETHLLVWSIRDLATKLGGAPSVIYHHVGGKDLLCRRVAERVFDGIELPPFELDWREWFRRMLGTAGRAVPRRREVDADARTDHSGGPADPGSGHGGAAAGGVRRPVRVRVRRAGQQRAAHGVDGDDRLLHEVGGPRDHATMMDEFRLMAAACDEVGAIGQEFILPFAEGGDGAAAIREWYYRFVVDTTIAVSRRNSAQAGPDRCDCVRRLRPGEAAGPRPTRWKRLSLWSDGTSVDDIEAASGAAFGVRPCRGSRRRTGWSGRDIGVGRNMLIW